MQFLNTRLRLTFSLSYNLNKINFYARINGEEVTLDQPAVILNDRTMTPARFVAEALGAKVDWDGLARKVTITK